MQGNEIIPIGEVSKRTGLAVSALRYYEEMGLIHPIRSAGGRRHFRRADIRRVSFVRIAQQFGFTLPRIATLLAHLPNNRAPNKRDWQRISRQFKQELEDKIATLETLRDQLDGCIGCGCLSLKSCALYNPQDQAQKHGDGPRYLMGDRPRMDG